MDTTQLHLSRINTSTQDITEVITMQSPSDHTKGHPQDSDQSFRFLDLPAEIRNTVYAEHLNFDNHWRCWPQILAASKHIHNEACAILYNHNTVEIELHTTCRPVGLIEGTFAIYINARQFIRITDQDASVGDVIASWPLWLRKFRDLRILLITNEEDNTSVSMRNHLFRSVNHHLYSLCCFLAETNAPKRMIIELKEQPNQGSRWVPGVTIWPLLKLANAKIQFKSMPESVTEYYQRQNDRSAPQAMDTFTRVMTSRKDGLVPKILDSSDYVDYDYDNRLTTFLKSREPNFYNKVRRSAVIEFAQGKEIIDLT